MSAQPLGDTILTLLSKSDIDDGRIHITETIGGTHKVRLWATDEDRLAIRGLDLRVDDKGAIAEHLVVGCIIKTIRDELSHVRG